jgi:hypothetical protein
VGNKKFIDTYKLSSEELGILNKAASDVFFFSQFVKVIHPLLGMVPFLLYPFQNQPYTNLSKIGLM